MEFNMLYKHKHNGLDAEKINPKDLLGFPIFNSTPTHKNQEGEVVLVNDEGNYKLCAFINGDWREIILS